MIKEYKVKSAKEMISLGKKFAQDLHPGDIVFLYGELGVGKTTFTKGLAIGLNIKVRITSPTFILHRIYSTDFKDIKTLHHIDLYRLQENNIKSFDVVDVIEDFSGIAVIEWPEKIESIVGRKAWRLRFYYEKDVRKVDVTYE